MGDPVTATNEGSEKLTVTASDRDAHRQAPKKQSKAIGTRAGIVIEGWGTGGGSYVRSSEGPLRSGLQLPDSSWISRCFERSGAIPWDRM